MKLFLKFNRMFAVVTLVCFALTQNVPSSLAGVPMPTADDRTQNPGVDPAQDKPAAQETAGIPNDEFSNPTIIKAVAPIKNSSFAPVSPQQQQVAAQLGVTAADISKFVYTASPEESINRGCKGPGCQVKVGYVSFQVNGARYVGRMEQDAGRKPAKVDLIQTELSVEDVKQIAKNIGAKFRDIASIKASQMSVCKAMTCPKSAFQLVVKLKSGVSYEGTLKRYQPRGGKQRYEVALVETIKSEAQTAIDDLVKRLGLTPEQAKEVTVISQGAETYNNTCVNQSRSDSLCGEALVDGLGVRLKLYQNEYHYFNGKMDIEQSIALVAARDLMAKGIALQDIKINEIVLGPGERHRSPRFDTIELSVGQDKWNYSLDIETGVILKAEKVLPPASSQLVAQAQSVLGASVVKGARLPPLDDRTDQPDVYEFFDASGNKIGSVSINVAWGSDDQAWRNAKGQKVADVKADGSKTTFEYDAAGRLTVSSDFNSAGLLISKANYQYALPAELFMEALKSLSGEERNQIIAADRDMDPNSMFTLQTSLDGKEKSWGWMSRIEPGKTYLLTQSVISVQESADSVKIITTWSFLVQTQVSRAEVEQYAAQIEDSAASEQFLRAFAETDASTIFTKTVSGADTIYQWNDKLNAAKFYTVSAYQDSTGASHLSFSAQEAIVPQALAHLGKNLPDSAQKTQFAAAINDVAPREMPFTDSSFTTTTDADGRVNSWSWVSADGKTTYTLNQSMIKVLVGINGETQEEIQWGFSAKTQVSRDEVMAAAAGLQAEERAQFEAAILNHPADTVFTKAVSGNNVSYQWNAPYKDYFNATYSVTVVPHLSHSVSIRMDAPAKILVQAQSTLGSGAVMGAKLPPLEGTDQPDVYEFYDAEVNAVGRVSINVAWGNDQTWTNAQGQKVAFVRADGVMTTYEYDANGVLISATEKNSSGVLVKKTEYKYNNPDDVNAVSQTIETTYDTAGNPTQAIATMVKHLGFRSEQFIVTLTGSVVSTYHPGTAKLQSMRSNYIDTVTEFIPGNEFFGTQDSTIIFFEVVNDLREYHLDGYMTRAVSYDPDNLPLAENFYDNAGQLKIQKTFEGGVLMSETSYQYRDVVRRTAIEAVYDDQAGTISETHYANHPNFLEDAKFDENGKVIDGFVVTNVYSMTADRQKGVKISGTALSYKYGHLFGVEVVSYAADGVTLLTMEDTFYGDWDNHDPALIPGSDDWWLVKFDANEKIISGYAITRKHDMTQATGQLPQGVLISEKITRYHDGKAYVYPVLTVSFAADGVTPLTKEETSYDGDSGSFSPPAEFVDGKIVSGFVITKKYDMTQATGQLPLGVLIAEKITRYHDGYVYPVLTVFFAADGVTPLTKEETSYDGDSSSFSPAAVFVDGKIVSGFVITKKYDMTQNFPMGILKSGNYLSYQDGKMFWDETLYFKADGTTPDKLEMRDLTRAVSNSVDSIISGKVIVETYEMSADRMLGALISREELIYENGKIVTPALQSNEVNVGQGFAKVKSMLDAAQAGSTVKLSGTGTLAGDKLVIKEGVTLEINDGIVLQIGELRINGTIQAENFVVNSNLVIISESAQLNVASSLINTGGAFSGIISDPGMGIILGDMTTGVVVNNGSIDLVSNEGSVINVQSVDLDTATKPLSHDYVPVVSGKTLNDSLLTSLSMESKVVSMDNLNNLQAKLSALNQIEPKQVVQFNPDYQVGTILGSGLLGAPIVAADGKTEYRVSTMIGEDNIQKALHAAPAGSRVVVEGDLNIRNQLTMPEGVTLSVEGTMALVSSGAEFLDGGNTDIVGSSMTATSSVSSDYQLGTVSLVGEQSMDLGLLPLTGTVIAMPAVDTTAGSTMTSTSVVSANEVSVGAISEPVVEAVTTTQSPIQKLFAKFSKADRASFEPHQESTEKKSRKKKR